MAPDHRGDDLDSDSNRKTDHEDRDEIESAMNKTRREIGGESESHALEQPGLPTVQGRGAGRDGAVSLETTEVASIEEPEAPDSEPEITWERVRYTMTGRELAREVI